MNGTVDGLLLAPALRRNHVGQVCGRKPATPVGTWSGGKGDGNVNVDAVLANVPVRVRVAVLKGSEEGDAGMVRAEMSVTADIQDHSFTHPHSSLESSLAVIGLKR